ncbi:hypothetical protein O181_053613 [Austropuccinia psidii MF-1]|uniref:Uncharacterized protein n=1 Tax=Austropuccinia psidii MF-1 TaxID=1389203 RepID=A0A9Q3E7Q4_9BASI|nr:hypothetical protein [Austropuccinia psidii MF-1]
MSIILPSFPLDHYFHQEINYVGEDVAVSSLHFFQGDMDLPPLSFHASLEEEPEDLETVLKVVSPLDNQDLDVSSKFKAEKCPPHHACDHHIELEVSLPPVCVIDSLSNHYSEELKA